MGGDDERRSSMWLYYDQRVAYREPGSQNVFDYFVGLGVDANLDTINSELRTISRRLGELTATSFLDLGAGPHGTFTLQLPGRGSALDQSDAALRRLRRPPGAPEPSRTRDEGRHVPVVGCVTWPPLTERRWYRPEMQSLQIPDERDRRDHGYAHGRDPRSGQHPVLL